jgi:hypothetical protein
LNSSFLTVVNRVTPAGFRDQAACTVVEVLVGLAILTACDYTWWMGSLEQLTAVFESILPFLFTFLAGLARGRFGCGTRIKIMM